MASSPVVTPNPSPRSYLKNHFIYSEGKDEYKVSWSGQRILQHTRLQTWSTKAVG